jgi:histone deacetylase 1/2
LEQLSALPHAPSVGLHEVPAESLGAHLGLPETDQLDEKLARKFDSRIILSLSHRRPVGHSHLVYKLQQESGTTTSESSSEDEDSSSTSSRYQNRVTKKRMSIITNRYHDNPSKQQRKEFERQFDLCSATSTIHGGIYKRRFFQSAATWDGRVEKVRAMNQEMTNGLLSDLTATPIEVNGRKRNDRLWMDRDHTDDPDGDGDYDDAEESGDDFGRLAREAESRHRMPLYY